MAAPLVAALGKKAIGAAIGQSAKSRTFRVVVLMVVAMPFAVLAGGVGVLILALQILAGAVGNSCPAVSTSVSLASVPAGPIEGYGHDQLVIAATIINAGAEMGVTQQGQVIAVMTSMGESSLQLLDHGDAVDNTTIGPFQQGESYGPREDRMDPTKAATAFYTRLLGVPGWDTMPPSLAAHKVQINGDVVIDGHTVLAEDYYTPFFAQAQAVVTQLTRAAGNGATCGASGDAKALATELMAAVDAGKLVGSTPDHIQEIRWIAEGQNVTDCGVDTRILQIMVVAVRSFDHVGVSDINRKCTGQIEGAGIYSSHYRDGGGKAVDFYNLNGHSLNGTDSDTLKLISILDPIVPAGTNVRQSECRAAAGIHLKLQNLSEFDDTCDHMHVDVGDTDGQLAGLPPVPAVAALPPEEG